MSLTTNPKLKNTTQIAIDDKYDVFMDENNESLEKKILLKNGLPFFDMKNIKSFRMLISGSSGSGKSYLCEKILEQIKPDIIYLFSSVNDDYKKFNVKRIDLNNILEKTPMSIHDIYELIENDAITIFDDIISFGTKNAKSYLELRLLCLTKGRHKNITTIIVEQQAQGGATKGAREVLLNCSYFIMFPRNNFRSFKAITTQYLGLEKHNIEYLKSLNSRYLMLSKNHPSYYVSSIECGMIQP